MFLQQVLSQIHLLSVACSVVAATDQHIEEPMEE